MKFPLPLALPLLAGFAAQPLMAQAGGFTPGDVWQSNDALAVSAPGSALTRIDPTTGVITPEHASPWQNGFGCLAFDPYRHRLIWRATITLPGQHIWQVDGSGNLTDIGLPTSSYSWCCGASATSCACGTWPRCSWSAALNSRTKPCASGKRASLRS